MSIKDRIANIFRSKRINQLEEKIRILARKVDEIDNSQWQLVSSITDDSQGKIFKAIKLSRNFYKNNPYYRQAIRLYSAFIFGKGATITTKDEVLQEQLNKLINSYDNLKVFFSPIAQLRVSNKLLRDGEMYIMFFIDGKGNVILRICDPLEITEIITEPDDKQTELYYKRVVKIPGSVASKELIYRSVEYFDYVDYTYANKSLLDLYSEETSDCYMMHIVSPETDILEMRGYPPFLSAIEWARLHLETQQDFIAYLRAITTIIAKEVVKGVSSLEEIKEEINRMYENVRFGTRIEYEGGDEYQPVERSGNLASVFERVARNTKLSVCAGTGIYEHYFGDPSTGNLATATSMELPMLKVFEQWQRFWEGVYKDVIGFYLKLNGFDENDVAKIEVKFPELLRRDVPQIINSVINAYNVGILDTYTAARIILTQINYDKVDDVLAEIVESEVASSVKDLAKLNAIKKLRQVIEKKI